MVIAVIYMLALSVTGAGWIVDRSGARHRSPLFAPIFIGLVLSYAAAMTALCLDPYYDDNGLAEFIDWRDRWVWAAGFGSGAALLVVPVVLACDAWRRKRSAAR